MHEIIRQLDAKRAAARLGGGQKRIDARHVKGKLTARAAPGFRKGLPPWAATPTCSSATSSPPA
jgi:hypothetical protein